MIEFPDMKVLMVHNRYRIRGGEDSVYETECQLLEKAGHVVVRYEKSNVDIPDGGGFRSKLVLAFRTVWNGASYCEIRELIRRERPDVMHCHNTFPLISPSIYWAAAREGVPLIQTLHNYRLACLNGYLLRDGCICERCLGRSPLRGVFRRCYRASFLQSATLAAMLLFHRAIGTWRRKVSRYIALTPFARDKFIAAGLPADKIVVKPNAFAAEVEENTSHPEIAKTSSGASMPDRLRVIYLGRLSPEKGVDVLLRAWALFLQKGQGGVAMPPADESGAESALPRTAATSTARVSEAELAIVGDGPERHRLAGLATELGISSSVRFLGAILRKAALRTLSTADLLVVPSLWYEQFATTPLESMALGVPVLVSDVTHAGTRIEAGVTGRFFPSGNPDALASVLHDLLSDPVALRRMGDAARAAFEASECRPDRNLARLLSVYASARGDGIRKVK